MEKNGKNILIGLYYYHPYVSGVSIYAKRLAEGLAAHGHNVTIITTKFEKDLKTEENINNVRVIRKPILFKLGKGVVSPRFLFSIIALSRKFNVINLHLPLAESGIATLFIPSKKIVTTYQCDINLGDAFFSKIIEKISFALMGITLRRSRSIVTLSMDYFLNSKMKSFAYKTKEVPPPIETSLFNRSHDTESFKKNLGLSTENFLIGFVGRIVYEKGIQYLLETIETLSKSIPSFKIIIAGDYENVAGGSIKSELDAYQSVFPGKIIFTGFLSDEDLVRFYSTIDVLVLPSIDPLEAFGMVQIEAMCCGCPVIASDMPGVDTAVRKTHFGHLSKPKDSLDIAKKIINTYHNGVSGRQFKKEDWDTKKTVQRYEEIF
ncbi:MAG: glycosyltransferase family 4 protein [Candidatus Moranbacteria bacterium]|nr:glycosyltransferase family 4 protein [Candidatus Moranbacteria bacterium]